WAEVRAAHGLRSGTLEDFVGLSFEYADYTMGYGRTQPGAPAIVSTIKLMQAGFCEVMDTEAMFAKAFAEMQAMKLLPPRQAKCGGCGSSRRRPSRVWCNREPACCPAVRRGRGCWRIDGRCAWSRLVGPAAPTGAQPVQCGEAAPRRDHLFPARHARCRRHL